MIHNTDRTLLCMGPGVHEVPMSELCNEGVLLSAPSVSPYRTVVLLGAADKVNLASLKKSNQHFNVLRQRLHVGCHPTQLIKGNC